MANWPCKNPSCGSHGQPHPNCKCPAPMAKGGKASNYCDSDRKHLDDCEYYADGGEIDPSKVVVDSASTEEIDPSKVKLDNSEIDPSKVEIDQPKSKYDTPMQQVGAAIEGVGQGIAGPVFTSAERIAHMLGAPNVSPEDIKGRADENPIIHGVAEVGSTAAGLMTGTGVPGLIGKGAKAIMPIAESAPILMKAGAAAIKGAIEMGALQSSDEITNAILGKGDPEHPVAAALTNIKMSAELGAAGGGLFNVIGQTALKGLQKIEASRIGIAAKNMMAGVGIASKMHELGIPIEQAEKYVADNFMMIGKDFKALEPGIKAYGQGLKNTAKMISGGAGATVGSVIGGTPGTLIGEKMGEKLFAPIVEKILNKTIPRGSKYIYPAILKSLAEGNTDGIFQAIDYAGKVSKGANQIASSVDNLFKAGTKEAIDMGGFDTDKEREKLHSAIESGGVNSQLQENLNNQEHNDQQYAEGGKVAPTAEPHIDHFSTIFPEQAMLLGAAKNRIYKYLNQNRPQPPIGALPFDKHVISKEQQRSYHKALDIANAPLSILNKVKDGSITSEDMQHFISMHPELHKHLSEKIYGKMAEQHLDEEKPSYRMRQSVSTFLGAPLEAAMTPFNIQQAQSTFMPKQSPGEQSSQPQGANKAKRGTAPLSKISSSFMTKDQHREERQNKT